MTEAYSDDPLDSIVQDDIDITVMIGGREYLPIDLEIELTDGAEGNLASGRIATPASHNKKPRTGLEEENIGNDIRPEKVEIDIYNDLMNERPGTQEISRVWTGYVSNASRIGNGMFEFRSFWPGHDKIQNASINVDTSSLYNPSVGLTDGDGNVYMPDEDPSEQVKTASFLAKKIGELVTEDTDFDYELNMKPNHVTVGKTPDGEVVRRANDIKVDLANIKSFKITKGEEGILTYLTNKTNSIWDVRRDGTFYIGAPQPTAHKLRYLVDMGAGKESPYYLSVQVIGNGIASQKGWPEKNMVNSAPESVGKDLIEDGDPYEVKNAQEELTKPTFIYRNLEIDTRKEAEDTVQGLVDKIKEQMGSGEIDVIGHPEVWPGDAVELPDAKKQPFANERYKVKRVVHRVNNDDGFLTKIEVGGMTKATETAFTDTRTDTIEYPDDMHPSDRQLYDAAREQGPYEGNSGGTEEGASPYQ